MRKNGGRDHDADSGRRTKGDADGKPVDQAVGG